MELKLSSLNCYIVVTFTGIYIVAAKRTAFGTFGGKLKDHSATELAAIASTAALKSGNISPHQVDSVNCGNVSAVSSPKIPV